MNVKHILVHSSKRQFCLAAVVLAFAIRLAALAVTGLPKNDELYEHGGIAHNLYSGHGFSYHALYIYTSLLSERRQVMAIAPTFLSANQPPLNPYLLYFTYCLFGETKTALLVLSLFNCVVGAGTVLIVYAISKNISHEAAARLSAISCALFLPGAQTVVKLFGTTIFIAIGLWSILALINALTMMNRKTSLLLGLSFGAWSWARSEAILLSGILLCIVGIVWYKRKYPLRAIALNITFTIGILIAVLSPWTYRNYLLFGRFMPTVSRPWHEVWRGNNILFEGSLYRVHGQPGDLTAGDTLLNRRLMMRLDSLPYDQKFEVRADDVFKDEALSYMKANPAHTVVMTALKAVEIWTFDMFYPKTRHPIYLLSLLPWTFFAIVGIALRWRAGILRRDQYAIIVCLSLIYAYYTGIFGVTFYMVRYQVYFISLLLPFVGIGVWRLLPNRFK